MEEIKENMQSKIFEMNILEGKLKQLDQQLGMVDQQIVEDEKLIVHLNELREKPTSDAILPLGGGIFARGSLETLNKVIVNIGSGILVEKNVVDGLKIIEKRMEKLLEAKEELGIQMRKVAESMSGIEKDIRG